MLSLPLLLAPFVVAVLTQGLKKVPVLPEDGSYRNSVIRFTAAVLSLSAAVVSSALSGEVVDVTIFSEAFLIFLESTGVYLLARK